MKPAFALDFRNDAIALLHRAAGGWHQVGRVTFDEPDLPAALGYLRSTALGLSPRGLATKLILPDDQILLTVVDAPGPDDASRAAQIRAGLEGRTPYAVEDLVFDWEIVGGEVRVAVVARDTLAEAEAFAVEHRFNPVAFVGAPASGFAAEPWFGPTAHAAEVLAAGEMLERDGTQVTVLARSFDEGAEAAAAPEPAPLPEPKPETAPEPAPLPEIPEPEPEVPAPADPPLEDPNWPEAIPEELAAEPVEDLPEDLPADPYAPALREPREAPVFGLADDEPAPSEVFRARPAEALPPAFAPEPDPVDDLPEDLAATLRDIALDDAAKDGAEDGADDEAPMAVDVEDDLPAADLTAGNPTGLRITDPALQDDVPPVPGYSPAMSFASRRASVAEGGAPKLAAPPPRPAVARPAGAKPLPPAAPKAERPMVDRPTAVNLAPQREKPRENKGLRGLGALVTAPGLPGSRKKKVAMPSPSPAVASPAEVNPEASAATLSPAAPATAEADPRRTGKSQAGKPQAGKALANNGLGTGRPVQRGKPRYLGLILTAVLLIVLAVIAAWSTSLAFRSDDGAEVQQAAADAEVPAPEDEMAADGELPEVADPELAALPEADQPATEAPVSEAQQAEIAAPAPLDSAEAAPADEPVATPAPGSATAGDEIVLATSDSAPDTPAPVDLPEATAQGDPLPLAQAPPPPFGTVYQFDANGLIVPTPEGIITPEGVRLVAGKPPRVPGPRPEGLAPAAPEAAPETAPETTAAAAVPGAETVAPATTFEADPAMAKFRPKTRPEGLVPPVQLNEAAAPESGTETAAEATNSDNRLAGLRPKARPGAVLAAGEAALAAKAASAASLTAQAETAAAANSGSPLAVAISRRPAARPQDLSRAVEAAVAAAVRNPEPRPEPEPEPTQTASLVAKAAKAKPEPEPAPEPEPGKKAKSKATPSGRDKKSEAEADDEPELEAAPKSKSSGSVAKQATFKNALAMDKTALIGVYGTPSNRYAMIRTSSGRYKKVKVGDSVDGGRIQAITASEVRYQKGSRLVTLALPRG